MIYTAADLQNLGSTIVAPDFIWEGLIPEKSKMVLLHGPGGSGKSSLIWSLFNAVEQGKPFLGLNTKATKTLIISTDMSIFELFLRWRSGFKPSFTMAVQPPFDLIDPTFVNSKTYTEIKAYVKDNGIGLIGIDTIGKVHARDGNKEDTVAEVYNRLQNWFPDITTVGNFHNKKSLRDDKGNAIVTEDDFKGNRKWVDDAVVQLGMKTVNKSAFHSRLSHYKSQVAALIDPIDIFINSRGEAELWNDNQNMVAIQQWGSLVASMPPNSKVKDMIDEYMRRHNVSEATAKRHKSAWTKATQTTP